MSILAHDLAGGEVMEACFLAINPLLPPEED